MSKFIEQAKEYFDLIENGSGAQPLEKFITKDAVYECDVLPMKTLVEYADWMQGIAKQVMPGCKYDLISVTSNDTQVVFCARFNGTHTGEGGPVAPTNRSTNCHYTYIIDYNQEGLITKMTKIWDQQTCFLQLGWPLPEKAQNEVPEKFLPK